MITHFCGFLIMLLHVTRHFRRNTLITYTPMHPQNSRSNILACTKLDNKFQRHPIIYPTKKREKYMIRPRSPHTTIHKERRILSTIRKDTTNKTRIGKGGGLFGLPEEAFEGVVSGYDLGGGIEIF